MLVIYVHDIMVQVKPWAPIQGSGDCPFCLHPTIYHRPFPILEFRIMSIGVAWKELHSEDLLHLTDRGEPLHWTDANSNLGAVSGQLPLRMSVEEK